jgi:hypothetical protein
VGAGAAARRRVGVEWRLVRVCDGDVPSPQDLPVCRFERGGRILPKQSDFQGLEIQESKPVAIITRRANPPLVCTGVGGWTEEREGRNQVEHYHSLVRPSFSPSFHFIFSRVEMVNGVPRTASPVYSTKAYPRGLPRSGPDL